MSAKSRSKKSTARAVPPKKEDQLLPSPIRSIDVDEFVRRLRTEASAEKRFALFLGAGCSVTSGIPAAGMLVKDRWIPRLCEYLAPHRKDADMWAKEIIKDYDSTNPARSYGSLIDKLFLWPEDRQKEIEALCEGRTPSFGYAVLAQLIAQSTGGFNVVLTTNFDDLIADALYLYTDARPLVIHHESLATYIRPTRTRPLVVKLHGDHRLSPRNTALETETLAQEIRRHTAMVLHDRGIIFMGYGGADHGILKMLNDLPSEALPFGAYWVHPDEPTGQVRDWLAHRQGIWVRSGWFDEVMLLVRNAFDLPHPSPQRFTRIFDEYQQKFKTLSAAIKGKPSNEAGVQALKEAVTSAEAVLPGDWKAIYEADMLRTENPDRADAAYREGIAQFPASAILLSSYANFLHNIRKDYDSAEPMFKRALDVAPNDPFSLVSYAYFLTNVRNEHIAAEVLYKRALESDPNYFDALANYALLLDNIRKDHGAAEAMYRQALETDPSAVNNNANLARLLLAEGKSEGMAVLRRAIGLFPDNPDPAAEIECAFYLYAHGQPPELANALHKIRKLLVSGVRSPGWDFSRNIERARIDGHPEFAWLGKLASVINNEAQLDLLDAWPAWRKAAA